MWWRACERALGGGVKVGPRGHARPVRHRPADRAGRSGDASCSAQLMALPKRYETVARLGATSSTGDPEGEIAQTGRRPARSPPPLPTGRDAPAPARLFGGEDRRRARLPRGAPRGGSSRCPSATSPSTASSSSGARTTRAAATLIECSAGTYVRSLIADLGRRLLPGARRTAIGPFEVREACAAAAARQPLGGPAADRARQALATRPIGWRQHALLRSEASRSPIGQSTA